MPIAMWCAEATPGPRAPDRSATREKTPISANIWNPVGSFDLGAEFLYGRVEERSGASANDPRFQITGRYTFVKLHPEETTP